PKALALLPAIIPSNSLKVLENKRYAWVLPHLSCRELLQDIFDAVPLPTPRLSKLLRRLGRIYASEVQVGSNELLSQRLLSFSSPLNDKRQTDLLVCDEEFGCPPFRVFLIVLVTGIDGEPDILVRLKRDSHSAVDDPEELAINPHGQPFHLWYPQLAVVVSPVRPQHRYGSSADRVDVMPRVTIPGVEPLSYLPSQCDRRMESVVAIVHGVPVRHLKRVPDCILHLLEIANNLLRDGVIPHYSPLLSRGHPRMTPQLPLFLLQPFMWQSLLSTHGDAAARNRTCFYTSSVSCYEPHETDLVGRILRIGDSPSFQGSVL